jgi:hypothetical protein
MLLSLLPFFLARASSVSKFYKHHHEEHGVSER